MRVIDFRKEPTSDGARVVARVIWEDVDRPPQDVFVAVRSPFDTDLAASTSFPLTAVAWPAYRAGERRVVVEGAVCPRLRDGLLTVLRVLADWYPPPTNTRARRTLPTIDATAGLSVAVPPAARRTGMFLSGGVDSLDLLLENRATFPPDHPLAVRDAYFVHGLDIGSPSQAPRTAFFERARAALAPVCIARGVTLVPVATNVRTLDPDGKSWPAAWFGPGTVALAHAFGARLTDVLFAASLDIEHLGPVGSHPMTDPYLSSGALAVHHEGVHRSRLAKLGRVAADPLALAALRVCWQEIDVEGPLNCGRCRKCVRVMLGLEAFGLLAAAPTFPRHEVTMADLEVCTVDAHMFHFYEELLEPLDRRGRRDLADGLRARLAAFAGGLPSRGAGPWARMQRRLRRLSGRP